MKWLLYKIQHNPGILISKTIFGSGSTQNNPFFAKNAGVFKKIPKNLSQFKKWGCIEGGLKLYCNMLEFDQTPNIKNFELLKFPYFVDFALFPRGVK